MRLLIPVPRKRDEGQVMRLTPQNVSGLVPTAILQATVSFHSFPFFSELR